MGPLYGLLVSLVYCLLLGLKNIAYILTEELLRPKTTVQNCHKIVLSPCIFEVLGYTPWIKAMTIHSLKFTFR